MKATVEMSKKTFYLIVGLCAVIIMMNSIESFIKAKDTGLFEAWLQNPNLNIDRSQTTNEMYSIYLTSCLSVFLIRIITPIALSLNSYFSLVKTGVNKLFVAIWMVLTIGLFFFTTLGETYFSIFFIISAICHIGLLCVLIYLWKDINKRKIIHTTQKTQQA